ncbi:MAG: PKD domain-containing protein [Bacteroidia bacterium]|nr:PKD domain-containing protein [Bacteroidia bacterium]
MKIKKYLICLVLFCLSLQVNAQITITKDEFPVAGNSFAVAIDSTFALDTLYQSYIDTSSADSMFWDFRGLFSAYIDSFAYLDPTTTPFGPDFPSADMATWIEFFGLNMYAYTRTDTSTGVWGVGANMDLTSYGLRKVNFFSSDDELMMKANATYGTQVSDSGYFESTGDTFFVNEIFKTMDFDGWGTLISPLDTFQVLRMKEYRISIVTVYYNLFGFPLKLGELFRDTTTEYQYLAKGIGHPVVTVSADVDNQIRYIEFLSEIDPAPSADFYVLNTNVVVGDKITFYNASASATSWFWDLGDGTTSTIHQPENTYDSVGVYDVSLAVSNINGNDTAVKQSYITVMNTVVANFGDSVNGMQVSFTDSSLNNPITWYWEFGDSSTAFEQNPTYTFAKPDTYTVKLTVNNAVSSDVTSKTVIVDWGDAISEMDQFDKLRIYPNPSSGLFTISYDELSKIKSVSLTDITGKVIFRKEQPQLDNLEVKIGNAGVYIIKVETEHQTINKKIVITKN